MAPALRKKENEELDYSKSTGMMEHDTYNEALKQQVLESVARIPIEYNPDGWKKLSQQLDAELPVGGEKTSIKWTSKLTRFGTSFTLVTLIVALTSSSQQSPTSSIREKLKTDKQSSPSILPNEEETIVLMNSETVDTEEKQTSSESVESVRSSQQEKKDLSLIHI